MHTTYWSTGNGVRVSLTLAALDRSFFRAMPFVDWKARRFGDNRWKKVDVLVMSDKPVGFDLIYVIDAITALGGIHITQTGAVRFYSKETPISAAIHIDQSNFSVKFNLYQRIWTASVAQAQLRNRCQSTWF